jgi:hypothetical protein
MVTAELTRPARLGGRARASLALELLAAYVRVRERLYRRDIRTVVADLRGGATAPIDGEAGPTAARLGHVVQRAFLSAPRRSRCLIESLVLIRLLARRGIEATLVIGVAAGSEFAAHAWVEREGRCLLPGSNVGFVPLVRL